MTKKYSKGEVSMAKELDKLTNRTFQLRLTEIVSLDNKSHELKISKSVMVRRALKAMYGISASLVACDVDFDISNQ